MPSLDVTGTQPIPFVDSLLCVTDFSPESENAFAHALAIAVNLRHRVNFPVRFTVLHAASGSDPGPEDWTHFPSVRNTLERWELLEPGSPRSAVYDQLGLEVQKIGLQGKHPLLEIGEFLERHPTDLIVLATEDREGMPRWLHPSLAENLVRRSHTRTLFVPKTTRGFVSETGHILLKRILIPVDHHPDPTRAIVAAAKTVSLLDAPALDITLLHIGPMGTHPVIDLPEVPGCSWQMLHREGSVVEEILDVARNHAIDLVVMATEGHHGILDALRGSITEQVVRHAPCPILAIPAC